MTVSEHIAAKAREQPDRVAISADGTTLTYGALEGRARRLAWMLRPAASSDTWIVALHADDAPTNAVATVAVRMAGGTWVQLPPRHPVERNAFILVDVAATAVVTRAADLEQTRALVARANIKTTVISVDDIPTDLGTVPPTPPTTQPTALLKYTSGSTGLPKGVCLPEVAVLHSSRDFAEGIGLTHTDRVACLTPLFSVAVFHGTLLAGATACFFDVQTHGVERLARWIDDEGITVLTAVPTLFRRLMQSLPTTHRLSSVRAFWLFGEPVTQVERAAWHAHGAPGSVLRVGLGSTEGLGFASTVIPWDTRVDDPVLPMRLGATNTIVRLVDDDGTPVAPGDVGEIEIASPFIFSGYWRRPDLTQAVLRVDPADPSRRIFRTGDLGRLLPDGRFFHAGRADRQVKVAGNRIEVAEIEHALRRVPGIRDAAVVPRTRGPGIVRLIACCVPGDAPPSRREVRDRLTAWLPPAMVPAAFVTVDALPTLPNGKTDYATLLARVGSESPPPADPRNPIEETLREIWMRALGASDIGIHDDFFLDLGGDSLAAAQCLTDVGVLFDRRLPLAAFHEATTIARFADLLRDDGWQPPADGQLIVHGDGPRAPLFGICGAYGHALRLLLLGHGLDPAQPFIGLQPPGMDWEAAGRTTIEHMAAHYADVIRATHPSGPYRLLGTSLGGLLAFETARRLQRDGAIVDLLAMVDTALPSCVGPAGLEPAPSRDFVAGDETDALVADGMRVATQHQRALGAYVLRHRFDGEILYFLCAETTDQRRLLWRRYASDGMRVITVPGAHGSFHREPQRPAIVAALREALATAPADEESLPGGGTGEA